MAKKKNVKTVIVEAAKNKAKRKVWKRPEDIKTFRTDDPKKMLHCWLSKRVTKEWTEKYIDEETKETVDIQRKEILFEKGKELTKDLIQKVMFAIQAGDIKDVECQSQPYDITRWIGNHMPAWEVVISANDKKKNYLVRAQCIETAIIVAAEYAGMYLDLSGYYDVKKVASCPVSVVEDDDPCIPEEFRDDSPFERDYYRVTVQTKLFYDIDDDFNKETHDFIIRASDVGEAKNRISEYVAKKFEEELQQNPHNEYVVQKAVPYQTDGIVPIGYCETYKQEYKY